MNTKQRRYVKRQHLDPAHRLISELGGIDAVASIVGRSRTSVYRWMLPEESGGTNGFIPAPAQRKLFEYAERNKVPKGVRDFFGGARAA